jgi:hypothetical protein
MSQWRYLPQTPLFSMRAARALNEERIRSPDQKKNLNPDNSNRYLDLLRSTNFNHLVHNMFRFTERVEV